MIEQVADRAEEYARAASQRAIGDSGGQVRFATAYPANEDQPAIGLLGILASRRIGFIHIARDIGVEIVEAFVAQLTEIRDFLQLQASPLAPLLLLALAGNRFSEVGMPIRYIGAQVARALADRADCFRAGIWRGNRLRRLRGQLSRLPRPARRKLIARRGQAIERTERTKRAGWGERLRDAVRLGRQAR